MWIVEEAHYKRRRLLEQGSFCSVGLALRRIHVIGLAKSSRLGCVASTFSWLATLILLPVGRGSKNLYRCPTAVSRRFEFVQRLVNQGRREVLIICRCMSPLQ